MELHSAEPNTPASLSPSGMVDRRTGVLFQWRQLLLSPSHPFTAIGFEIYDQD
jgi:hypothetical protein